MPINRVYKRPVRYSPEDKKAMPQPFGGAIPAVQRRFINAQNSAMRTEFPAMAALIYAPPSIVALPVEISTHFTPGGMADRIYQPAAEKPRAFGDKIASWFQTGRFE